MGTLVAIFRNECVLCLKLAIYGTNLYLPRDAMHCAVLVIVILSVYGLSVCLSVWHTRGLCPHGSTYDHDFYTLWLPHDSSFWGYHVHPKIWRWSPRARAMNEGGVGTNLLFSTLKPPYLRNGARCDRLILLVGAYARIPAFSWVYCQPASHSSSTQLKSWELTSQPKRQYPADENLTLILSTPWMQVYLLLGTIVCKFGGDPIVCLRACWKL